MPLSTQILGGFKTGMDQQTRQGGKSGAQTLWNLQNGYVNARGDVVARPGLTLIADVANSAGLYGFKGQLHVFYGPDQGFVNPGNALVEGHVIQYPIGPLLLSGHLPDSAVGDSAAYQYTVTGGSAPVIVSVTSGALPTGRTVDASGNVTGTDSAAGSFSWTLTATDSIGTTATLNDSAVIALSPPDFSSWRYLGGISQTDTTDRSGVSFDDSGWSVGPSPFADSRSAPYTSAPAYNSAFSQNVGTNWVGDYDMWLRRTLTLSSVPAGGITVTTFMDNAFNLYFNGVAVHTEDFSTDPVGGQGRSFSVSAANLVVGANIIAAWLTNHDGGPTYCYFDALMVVT